MVHEYQKRPVVVRVTEDEENETFEADKNSPGNQPIEVEMEPEPPVMTVIPVSMYSTQYTCLELASSVLESEEWLDAVKKDFVSVIVTVKKQGKLTAI
jgi:hypothetical protein